MAESIQQVANKLYRGVGLAPMVRSSTTPLRNLALRYGADFCYTEELIDRSILESRRTWNETLHTVDYVKDISNRSKKQKKKKSSAATALLLRIDKTNESNKLILQIGTGEAETAVAAARKLEQDICAVDVNMGCPKKFSVSGGMGSALLSDPERACGIIRRLRDALSVPVSCKIRLLKTVSDTVEFVDKLIAAGANAVAIHGRRVGDPEVQPADWDSLREVVSALASKHPIPILINGDFYTRDGFETFMKETGASGVLLARPALYNCSIFRKPLETGQEQSNGYDSALLLPRMEVVQEYLRHGMRYDYHQKNMKYVICEMLNLRRTPSPIVPLLQDKFDKYMVGKVSKCKSTKDLCELFNVAFKPNSPNSLQPGEHKYSDEYLLNHATASSEPSSSQPAKNEAPASKRVKVNH